MTSPAHRSFSLLRRDVAPPTHNREQHGNSIGLILARRQLLADLPHGEGSHQAKLAEILEFVSVTVDRLAEAIFAECRGDPIDRHLQLLFPTKRARSLLDRRELAEELYAKVIAGFEGAEPEHLGILAHLRANFSGRYGEEGARSSAVGQNDDVVALP
jgi:MarR family transcriptional regulator, transcriptional regulator for hemolysin